MHSFKRKRPIFGKVIWMEKGYKGYNSDGYGWKSWRGDIAKISEIFLQGALGAPKMYFSALRAEIIWGRGQGLSFPYPSLGHNLLSINHSTP